MNNYKIAFVGLGSIATRHLKNVRAYLASQGDSCTVDLYRSSLGRPLADELQPLVNNIYLFADEIPSDRQYDVVFVTNPTSMHYETVERFAAHTKSFFIEKPVFDSTEVDEKIFEAIKGIPSYVACPLHYNAVLQYVKQHVNPDDVICARAMSSSYLPDWRPGQDYRNTYSALISFMSGIILLGSLVCLQSAIKSSARFLIWRLIVTTSLSILVRTRRPALNFIWITLAVKRSALLISLLLMILSIVI